MNISTDIAGGKIETNAPYTHTYIHTYMNAAAGFLESQFPGQYMDINGQDSGVGAQVVLRGFTGRPTQLWEFSARQGYICSRSNGLVLDIAGTSSPKRLPCSGSGSMWWRAGSCQLLQCVCLTAAAVSDECMCVHCVYQAAWWSPAPRCAWERRRASPLRSGL